VGAIISRNGRKPLILPGMETKTLASYFDHTILRPDCTVAEVKKCCAEAMQYCFHAVCIPPYYVNDARQYLADARVKIATVVGFPLGYSSTPAKVKEMEKAMEEGADEIDAVINFCAVKNGAWNFVKNEMESLTMAAHLKGKVIKVILETGIMSEIELRRLCDIALEVGPDFVKTSTGFNGVGASVPALHLLSQLLGGQIKIKASGGIRDLRAARAMIEAGAQRLGASASVKIIEEL
jgi:deoxyribose-phosphate aldolase